MGNEGDVIGRSRCEARPSLAITKYWGKRDVLRNTPATPSLGVTLGGLSTVTEVEIVSRGGGGKGGGRGAEGAAAEGAAGGSRGGGRGTEGGAAGGSKGGGRDAEGGAAGGWDSVTVGGIEQPRERFAPFFGELRRLAGRRDPGAGGRGAEGAAAEGGGFLVRARSDSNFPVSAGIASSSSGFAALAVGCVKALGLRVGDDELSALARIGSASAARAVFGGFTLLPAGADAARRVFDESWWPELRIVVVEVEKRQKSLSSRDAMEETRRGSPYYESWLADSGDTTERAIQALAERSLERLGPLIRRSCMGMFASMLGADPAIRYWSSGTMRVLDVLEGLRREGVAAWETMDAGPQVKVFTLESDLDAVLRRLEGCVPSMGLRVCRPGAAPEVLEG